MTAFSGSTFLDRGFFRLSLIETGNFIVTDFGFIMSKIETNVHWWLNCSSRRRGLSNKHRWFLGKRLCLLDALIALGGDLFKREAQTTRAKCKVCCCSVIR